MLPRFLCVRLSPGSCPGGVPLFSVALAGCNGLFLKPLNVFIGLFIFSQTIAANSGQSPGDEEMPAFLPAASDATLRISQRSRHRADGFCKFVFSVSSCTAVGGTCYDRLHFTDEENAAKHRRGDHKGSCLKRYSTSKASGADSNSRSPLPADPAVGHCATQSFRGVAGGSEEEPAVREVSPRPTPRSTGALV